MAYSKVAYGGHTLIDLTQDTAVESDVASGKWFHKADGTRVQGTASGGITPTGTINITTNGTHNVTDYASAAVNVPATFGRPVVISIGTPLLDDEFTIYYRGYDPNDINKVIWRSVTVQGDRSTPAVANINLVPNMSVSPADSAENFVYDGVYIKHPDGMSYSYPGGSPTGATYRFTSDSVAAGEEMDYWTIESAQAGIDYT